MEAARQGGEHGPPLRRLPGQAGIAGQFAEFDASARRSRGVRQFAAQMRARAARTDGIMHRQVPRCSQSQAMGAGASAPDFVALYAGSWSQRIQLLGFFFAFRVREDGMSNVEVKAGTCWRSHDCDDSWDRVRWNGDTLEYVFEDGTTESSGLDPPSLTTTKTWKRVPDVSLRELSKPSRPARGASCPPSAEPARR